MEVQTTHVRLLRKQNDLRACEAEWAAARGGVGSGKTSALCWWLLERMEQYPKASAFTVGATFEQLRHGIYRTFVGILENVVGWERDKHFSFRDKSGSPLLTFEHSGAALEAITAEQRDRIRSVEIQTLVCEEPQTWVSGEESWHSLFPRLRVSQGVSALYPDIRPMGRLSFNPPTKGHWLYELIERAWPKQGYPCWQFSLRDNVLMPQLKEYVASLQAQLPQHLWASEIDGEWRTASEAFFPFEDLQAALESSLEIREVSPDPRDDYGRLAHGEVYVDAAPWHSVYPQSRYVHFWDLADKQDWTVGITLDTTYGDRMTVVEFERFNKRGWKHVYDRIRDRHQRYSLGGTDYDGSIGASKTFIDSTGVGDAVLDELVDIRAEGLKFTAKTKPEVLAALQSVLSTRELKFPMVPQLFDELRFYEREDEDLVQDCVMALTGAVWFGRRKTPSFSFTF